MSGEAHLERPAENSLRQAEALTVGPTAVEFRELRYFTVLCEELHFGRAAERLHISQSPLSQTIAQLERKVGTRLLDRSSRHVELTAAGGVLLEHARRLLGELDDAVAATRRAGTGETGVLRVAAGPVSREALLPALRHELDSVFPDLVVEVAEETGDVMVDRMLHGGSDVVVMLCAPTRDDTHEKLLRRDRPIAVVHREHELAQNKIVTIADLAKHTLVLAPRLFAKGSHDLVQAMFHGRPPASTRVADQSSGAFWDAMRADGFAVLPSSAPVSGDFVRLPIADTTSEFTISMVWSRKTPPAMIAGLIEAADAAIAANGWLVDEK